jgi:hypothetical protein
MLSAIGSAILALGLLLGVAPAPAQADVLDDLAQEFSVGSGAGQVANLLKATLKLRAQGYRPSKANLQEITEALDYRPNQKPLIDALTDTLAYQTRIKAQSQMIQGGQNANSAVMGAGQMPSDGRMNTAPQMPAAPAPVPAPAPAG